MSGEGLREKKEQNSSCSSCRFVVLRVGAGGISRFELCAW